MPRKIFVEPETAVERFQFDGTSITTSFGTVAAEGKPRDQCDAEGLVMKYGFQADLAFVRALEAEIEGGLVCWMTSPPRCSNTATAAAVTVVEAEELAPIGAIKSDGIHAFASTSITLPQSAWKAKRIEKLTVRGLNAEVMNQVLRQPTFYGGLHAPNTTFHWVREVQSSFGFPSGYLQ